MTNIVLAVRLKDNKYISMIHSDIAADQNPKQCYHYMYDVLYRLYNQHDDAIGFVCNYGRNLYLHDSSKECYKHHHTLDPEYLLLLYDTTYGCYGWTKWDK